MDLLKMVTHYKLKTNNNMKKKSISWQLQESTIAKVKQQATKDKVAIQVKAEQLLIIALEGKLK